MWKIQKTCMLIIASLICFANPSFAQSTSAADWSGFYVGISAASVDATATFCQNGISVEFDCSDPVSTLPTPKPSGSMIGLRVGYDFAAGPVVVGVMGDIMRGSVSGSAETSINPFFGCGSGCTFEVSQISMLRGRIGYPIGRFMPYLSAGSAVSKVSIGFDPADLDEGTLTNKVFGLGAEYKVSETLTLGLDAAFFQESDDDVQRASCLCGASSYSASVISATLAYNF